MLKKILENKKLLSDIILIGVLLIVSLSVFLIWYLSGTDGSTAVVTVDGKRVGEYSLAIDGVYYINDGTNVLAIEDGKAYMKEASCPGYQDCVETGKISRVGETIVCLPNKVVVEIVGEGDELIQ
ncbi:MAG: NusG domain II-containing protein [Clostridia bacterium]|nr:NusG domain II-containing protein [Clostridia bacterium]